MAQAGGCATSIYLTVSTGIEAGLILNGQLYRGADGGGELGHDRRRQRPAHTCGMVGCLEVLASGTAIARMRARPSRRAARRPAAPGRDGRRLDGCRGRPGGRRRRSDSPGDLGAASHYLGVGLANYINIFNPEAIVVGGGVTRIGHQLLEPAFALAKSRAFDSRPSGSACCRPPSKADPRCSASGPSHATASELGYTIPRAGRRTADHTHRHRTCGPPASSTRPAPHGEDERDAQTSQGPRPLDRRQASARSAGRLARRHAGGPGSPIRPAGTPLLRRGRLRPTPSRGSVRSRPRRPGGPLALIEALGASRDEAAGPDPDGCRHRRP